TQARQHPHRCPLLLGAGVGSDLLQDDGLGALHLLLAQLAVLRGDPLQVVEVVDVHVLQLVRGGLYVPGERQVDEEQGPVSARLDRAPDELAGDDRLMRGGGTEDHVCALQQAGSSAMPTAIPPTSCASASATP